MSNSKISNLLPANTPLVGTEVLPLVQVGATKQVSAADLTAGRAVSALSFEPTGDIIPTNGVYLGATNTLTFATDGAEVLRLTADGDVHTPAGAAAMTSGFIYIPADAGVPTGTPAAISGTVPMYYDTLNDDFYIYSGAWKKVTLT